MSILAWVKKKRKQELLINNSSISKQELQKNNLEIKNSNDNALWTRCDYCGVILYIKHLKKKIRI